MGEDAEELETVVDGFVSRLVIQQRMSVAGGDFALLDGKVDDIQRAAHIASSEDVRLGGLHAVVDDDLTLVSGDSGSVEIYASRCWFASHGEEDLIDADVMRVSVSGEFNALSIFVGGNAIEVSAEMHAHAALGVGFGDDIAAFAVEAGEELGIALNQGHSATHRLQVVCHFECNSAAAEHGDGLG